MRVIKSLIERIGHETECKEDQPMDYEGDGRKAAFETGKEERAVQVGLSDFSEQLTAGVLRAVEAQAARPGPGTGGRRWPPHPVIWCGIIIRPPGPFDESLLVDEVKQG